MLEGLIVAGWEVGNFLNRLGDTCNLEDCHILLTRLELTEWAIHNDLLADVIRRSQVHWSLLLIVFEASCRTVLD